jgi:hypothetical protein
MKEPREVKNRKIRARLAALAMVIGAGTSAHAGEWTNAITPYIWVTGMTGRVVIGTPLGPLDAQVNQSFSDLVKNLDFGAMVSYEGGRDKWVVLGDLIYMNLGGAKTSTTAGVTLKASADFEQTMLEADVGYRVTPNITLLAGVRYHDIAGHRCCHQRPGRPDRTGHQRVLDDPGSVCSANSRRPNTGTGPAGMSAVSASVPTSPGRSWAHCAGSCARTSTSSPAIVTRKWITIRTAAAGCSYMT